MESEYILAEKQEKTDLYQETGNHSSRDFQQVEAELAQLYKACIMSVDILEKIHTDMEKLVQSVREQH